MTRDVGLDTDEVLDLVSRRAAVIESLHDGPKYNRDIRDELGVSRSTVYKAVSELEEFDIACRGDNGYELTVLGRFLFERYRQIRAQMDDICRASSLLTVLPKEVDLPYTFVEDADVYISERHAPNRPVREIEQIVTDASKIKGTGPVVLPRYVELFSSQVVADELDAELVFEVPAFEHLQTNYTEDFTRALSRDNLEVGIIDTELPFGLLVIEEPRERTAVIVYDDAGDIKGLIVNDTDGAVRWGRKRWERRKESATVAPSEIPE